MNSWLKPREDRLGCDDSPVVPATALGDELNVRIEVAHFWVRMFEEVGYTLNVPVVIEDTYYSMRIASGMITRNSYQQGTTKELF